MKSKCLTGAALAGALALVLVAGLASAQATQTTPLGTAFTYQGHLTDGGAPAEGTYDFEFKLYDAESGGSQVGSTVTLEGISVSEGRFTVRLDFGGSAFTGQERWLEVGVRPGTSGAGYTPLSPRQALTAAPYALYALSAAPHSHLGETWTGNNNPLVITGTFGAPGYAPLVLGNSVLDGDGVAVEYARGDGLDVHAAGYAGVQVGYVGLSGVYVERAGAAGMFVRQVGSPSTTIYDPALRNGFEVAGAQGNGLRVGRADANGVHVNAAGGDGVYVYSAGSPTARITSTVSNGLEVAGAQGNGLYVGQADGSGVYVNSAEDDGVAVAATNYRGVYVGSVAEDGVYVNVAGTDGVHVNSAGNNGVYVGYAYGDGVRVEHAEVYAGYFNGAVHVNGTLTKSGGSFKIDHPLEPETKYLNHSFVESPDMMNIYNGNVTTDQAGYATVRMPDYFEALNQDFRYQLTVIGVFAQAIIAQEVEDGRFVIQTDKPNVKVSWQVTGIRQDPWAEANRIPVEEDKPAEEQGTYLHPEAYGLPESMGLAYKEALQRGEGSPQEGG